MAQDQAYQAAEQKIEAARRAGAKELDLSAEPGGVDAKKLTELPEALSQLTQLERLDLARNQLASLPEWVGRLTQLQSLDLSGNRLTQLPKSLGQLKQLQWLGLRGNPLPELPGLLDRLPDSVEVLLERAWLRFDRRQYEAAVKFFDRLLTLDPQNADAMSARIFSLRKLRRFPDAQHAIDAALKLFPNNTAFLIEHAKLRHNQKQFDEAIRVFDQVLAIEPLREVALCWRVNALRQLRRFKDAQQAVDEALCWLPGNVGILNERAWLQYDQERYDEAIKVFDQVLAVDPGNEDALRWRITSLRLMRRFAEAQTAVNDALVRLPGCLPILHESARLRHDQGQYDEAIKILDQVLAADASNEDALRWRINALRKLRRFVDAQSAIDAALRKLPGNAAILTELAWLHYDQDQYAEAIEIFDQVLAVDASNEDALRWRITSCRLLRRFADAQKAVGEALRLFPGNVTILNESACLLYDQRQYEAAAKVFDQVLAIDAKNEVALRWRSACFRVSKRFAEARKAVDTALAQLPGNVALLNEQAWLCCDQKQYDEAIKVFDKVLAIEPMNEDALRWRVVCLRLLRRYDQAATCIRQALEQNRTAGLLEEQGWLAFDQDRFDEAVKMFGAALDLNPGLISAAAAKAKALGRLNRDSEALELLRARQNQFRDKDEVYSEITEAVGFYYLDRNDSVAAQKEFRGLLAKDSSDIRGINGIGAAFYTEGRYDQAVGYFQQVVAIAPYMPVFHTNLGYALVKQEPQPDLELAEKSCQRALALEPRNTSALGCLGLIAFKRGRLREAEDCFRSSIAADKEFGRHADLGALCVLMGRYEDAEQALREAIRINKDDPQPHIELANLFLQTEKTKEAVRECRLASAIAPGSESAARALAIALIHAEDYGEAEKILRQAIRGLDESKRWQLHLTLSQLLTRLGDKTSEDDLYEEALKEVKTAIRLKPKTAELYFHKGILRSKCKDPFGAQKDFEECLRLDAHHFEAERYARLVRQQARDDIHRGSKAASWMVVGIAIVLLSVLWFKYFVPRETPAQPAHPVAAAAAGAELVATNKPAGDVPSAIAARLSVTTPSKSEGTVSETMLTVMTPLLLGMIIVGFLLPALIRLKFAGVEAELTQPKEVISNGPKGEVSLGGSLSTIKQ